MADQWTIRGVEYGNCNCDWGCPCQFGSSSTYGYCEAIVGGIIEEGHFNDTSLNGLKWAMVLKWPGEIADGNGTQQAFIDEKASDEQRQALRKILHGESTAPGSTHFFVYNSTMSEVLETQYVPIHLTINVDARQATLDIPGYLESSGSPLIDPFSQQPKRALIQLPTGFEYTIAEMGNGNSQSIGEIPMTLENSYGQFNALHMNQDGVIR